VMDQREYQDIDIEVAKLVVRPVKIQELPAVRPGKVGRLSSVVSG
jgi:hypothetical protein